MAIRHVSRQDCSIRAGRWDRAGARPARRVKACTLGLIAFGSTARALAERAAGFGTTILVYDPYVDAGTIACRGARKVEHVGLYPTKKEPITDRCHVAVRVSSFEKAVACLEAQGVSLEEPKIRPGVKAVFLKERDPAGNIVHLLWMD